MRFSYSTCIKYDEEEGIMTRGIGNREWRVHTSFGRSGRREWARAESGILYIESRSCIFKSVRVYLDLSVYFCLL